MGVWKSRGVGMGRGVERGEGSGMACVWLASISTHAPILTHDTHTPTPPSLLSPHPIPARATLTPPLPMPQCHPRSSPLPTSHPPHSPLPPSAAGVRRSSRARVTRSLLWHERGRVASVEEEVCMLHAIQRGMLDAVSEVRGDDGGPCACVTPMPMPWDRSDSCGHTSIPPVHVASRSPLLCSAPSSLTQCITASLPHPPPPHLHPTRPFPIPHTQYTQYTQYTHPLSPPQGRRPPHVGQGVGVSARQVRARAGGAEGHGGAHGQGGGGGGGVPAGGAGGGGGRCVRGGGR